MYRLANQRLGEHLRPGAWTTPWKPVGEPAAVALANALGEVFLAWIGSGQPPEQRLYLWRYYWQHAVDAGEAGMERLRELSARDPAFLPYLASATIAH